MTTDTIEAPAPAAEPLIANTTTSTRDIPLGLIVASPKNPRRHHADAAIERRRWNLDELADSIRQHGVMQPILVRPRPGGTEGDGQPLFELVAGERRLLASGLAGAATVPALVRPLTDIQALVLQVIENGQREDLHPLEEALGFRNLLDTPGGYNSVDEIALRVGKTKRWVYNRLALLGLCEEAQRALFADEISASVALELAEGVPSAAEQRKHLVVLVAGWGGQAFTARSTREYLRKNAMLRLDRAPFATNGVWTVATFRSDGDYCIEATRTTRSITIGACDACPKRTGAKPDFFDDVKEGDLCQDAACYQAKSTAAHELLLQTAREEGAMVVVGVKAKTMLPNPNIAPRGYWFYDRPCPDLTRAGEPLNKLIKLTPDKLLIVDHPDSKSGVITLANDLYVRDALSRNGLLQLKVEPKPAPKKALPKKAKDGGGALLPPADSAVRDSVDDIFDEVLEFPVFPLSAKGQPTPAEVRNRTQSAEYRARALIIGRALSKHLRKTDETGMPDIARAVLLQLVLWDEAFVSIEQMALMLDITPAASGDSGVQQAWAWSLSEEQATRMVVLCLALMDTSMASKEMGTVPAYLAEALGINPVPLLDQAEQLVAERVRLELVARAAPKKAKKAKDASAAAQGDAA